MKLSTHNQLAMLYRNFYNRSFLPNNLCNYFWLLLVALICTPFVYPVLILNKFISPFEWSYSQYYRRSSYNNIPIVIGVVFNVLIFLFGILLSQMIYGRSIFNLLELHEIYTNGIILTSIVLTLIVTIVFIIKKIPYHEETDEEWELKYKAKNAKQQLKELRYKQSFRYLLVQRFKAWKNNNCPIIEWDTSKE